MASKTVSIFVNVKGNAQKALKGIGTQLGKNEKQVKSNAGAWKKLASAVGGMVVFTKLIAWQKENTRLALIQERAEKRLEAVYGKNIDSLKKYASALQNKSTFGDEEILLAQSKLAVFVKEEEQLKALTQATLDFAVVTGMDLNSSMALVGKSVGSSTNALSRYGIVVEGAVGSVERVSSAVENMNALFAGAALADSLTISGQIEQAENAIGDLREEMGGKFVHSALQAKIATKNFYTYITDNSSGVGKSIGSLSRVLGETLKGWNELYLASRGEKFRKQQDDIASVIKQHRIERNALRREVKAEQEINDRGSMTDALFIKNNGAKIERIKALADAIKDLKGQSVGLGKDFNAEFQAYQATLVDSSEAIPEYTAATEKSTKATEANASAIKNSNAEYAKYVDGIVAGFEQEIFFIEERERIQASKDEEERVRLETRKQTTIDIAQQTVQGVALIMSAANNNRQQEHDNRIREQKEDVKNSTLSAKQKAKALQKIEEQASKDRLKLRIKEWRTSLIMSIGNGALAVTKTLATGGALAIPAAIATGAFAALQTGIIGANKPKFYNGGTVHSKTGQLGDVIPVMAREGETFSTPAQQKNKNGGTTTVTIGAPQITIQGNADANTVGDIKQALMDHARTIEDMFVDGTINASKVSGALAV